ncbi:MAG TPA: dihydropteroate synthase [Bacteroidales bacterium]|nr:dihydropteroate synthase [Bacteroidales bacterium]
MADKPKYISAGGKLIDLTIPKVMGIINITPDSFYNGSRASGDAEVIALAEKMLRDGADILDIGGYSSRPRADDITVEEESRRVLNAISLVRKEFPGAIISVDTFRAEVAQKAVSVHGANIINDISGGETDEKMFEVVARLNVPYIMMHMKGNPRTMQDNPQYEDVVADILMWFGKRIVKLQDKGVKDIIIDPGFGFGKTIKHNFDMLERLGDFAIAGLPLLVGISRKSMIWKSLSITPDEALNGTSVLNTVALLKGADILRVHDVKEAVQAVRLIQMLKDKILNSKLQTPNSKLQTPNS